MKSAWDEVAESFSALGRVMKERYSGGATPEEDAAAAAAEGRPPAGDPATPLREAFEHLLAAGKEFGDRTAGLVRDDDIKAEVKHVANSLSAAIEATVDQIGDEVRGFFKGPREGQANTAPIETEATTAAPPAGSEITDAEPPDAAIDGGAVVGNGDDEPAP
jgi:hypothetical protein